MKFLVTDAQLAAMRLVAATAVRADYMGMLNAQAARFDGELLRLRLDREQELARVADPQAPFVAHLQAEVEFWRVLYTAERQRNDVSTDQRLAERGLGGITGPTRPLAADMPSTLDELLRTTEMGDIGRPEGVAR
jgi:hypothetical protein